MTLNELEIGKSAVIVSVGGQGALRQHFLDMGVIPGTEVTMVKLAPMGDPMELRIHGYELTLRLKSGSAPYQKRMPRRSIRRIPMEGFWKRRRTFMSAIRGLEKAEFIIRNTGEQNFRQEKP